jgi:hypothetical protein
MQSKLVKKALDVLMYEHSIKWMRVMKEAGSIVGETMEHHGEFLTHHCRLLLLAAASASHPPNENIGLHGVLTNFLLAYKLIMT